MLCKDGVISPGPNLTSVLTGQWKGDLKMSFQGGKVRAHDTPSPNSVDSRLYRSAVEYEGLVVLGHVAVDDGV